MPNILVVDDEEGLREFLAEALLTDGHSVTTAADGQEALDLLGRQGFDLLLTDLKMPRVDGLELVRRARADLPEMEVVVLTAHASVDSAVEAMKLGAYDYLEKPISSPTELRLLARRALERRQLKSARERERRQESGDPPLSYGDPIMEPVVGAIAKVGPTEATVLLAGESGTGKELAARAVHHASQRSEGPFVAVNCAAISDTLIESELFGHEKGAFTGATQARQGRIELAAGGSFFLDEVGELKLELQAKLLRVLQEKTFERVGGSRSFAADVRWIAASNRDLATQVREGAFREDLYHRLAVFPIRLPALRERRRDLAPLAERLLASHTAALGKPPLALSQAALAHLESAPWPGNVRELSNVLERAAILADGPALELEHLQLSPMDSSPPVRSDGSTLADLERAAIERALAEVGGNRRLAAERLGIGVRTLYDKLKRYDLG